MDTLLGRIRVLRACRRDRGRPGGRARTGAQPVLRRRDPGGRVRALRAAPGSTPERARAQRRPRGLPDPRHRATPPRSKCTSTRRASSTCPAAAWGWARSPRSPSRPSIGNAVHNATGWRPYELPIRPDRLLQGIERDTCPEHDRGGARGAGEFRAGGTDLQQRLRSGVSSRPARSTSGCCPDLDRARLERAAARRRIGALVPIAHARRAIPGSQPPIPGSRRGGRGARDAADPRGRHARRKPAAAQPLLVLPPSGDQLPEEGRRRLPGPRRQPPATASASTSAPAWRRTRRRSARRCSPTTRRSRHDRRRPLAVARALRRRRRRPPRPPARRATRS